MNSNTRADLQAFITEVENLAHAVPAPIRSKDWLGLLAMVNCGNGKSHIM